MAASQRETISDSTILLKAHVYIIFIQHIYRGNNGCNFMFVFRDKIALLGPKEANIFPLKVDPNGKKGQKKDRVAAPESEHLSIVQINKINESSR